MAFNATYTSSDITAAANDGIARGFIVVGSLAGVIVLVLLGVWAFKRFGRK